MPRLPFLLLIEEKEVKEDQGDDCHQVFRIGAEGCFGLHGVRWVGVGGSLGFRGGFALAPRLPFLLLIEEKEAKEDQGDDRLQVGRIGAEGCLGFHRAWPDRCGELFWLSWGWFGWV